MNKRIVYSLNVEDIQTVAGEVLGRALTEDEIKMVEDAVGEKVRWFDAIEQAINEKIRSE
ncbi:MAG: hypothetical protein OXU61_11640 [Gammaproteobacteria bacterium]|nr:hypothetical protein [Gammaproteobacteria bacterium]